ncbi:MAG: LegC family aminotransferase [candidate division WOR-3 bacterium]|nr:MAG: LegC family aminotransferase [candidate division WOR-3 bacterium]
MIPISIPHIAGNEWRYIKECLDTAWVSSVGKYVDKFEEEVCGFTGAKYGVACVNGTAALHVALRLVGVEPGDEVIVPSVTFIAPVNVVRYLSAEPVFMDCDEFYNIYITKVLEFIDHETVFRKGYTYNKRTNRCIRAIIPVHVFGNAVRMLPLKSVCQKRNIKIVEDATESLGTVYSGGSLNGRHTGTTGDLGCFSFNGNKIITTGGGGMIVTDNKDYSDRARYLTMQAKDDGIRYVHDDIGYNYRLTNIQAALGVAQLEQLPGFIKVKRSNYELYKQRLDEIPGLGLAETPDYAVSNCWYYCMQVDRTTYGMDREQLMIYLQENGIQSRPLWQLNHQQKPYLECQSYHIERAHILLEKTLNIPCSIDLTSRQINKVIRTLRSGYKRKSF